MLADLFRGAGHDVVEIRTPAYMDCERGIGRPIRYLGRMLRCWAQAFAAGRTGSIVLVSISQSWTGFIREGIAFLLANRPRCVRVMSLHGSVFMRWGRSSPKLRALAAYGRCMHYVTVLGDRQRQQLSLAIPAGKIIVVPNAVRVSPIAEEALVAKHGAPGPQGVSVLYLSNLIETKGYPEFLEALLELSRDQNGPVLSAKLVGDVWHEGGEGRFRSEAAAREWIEAQVSAINASARVKISWIRGATGTVKEQLFFESSIFVLPSYYPVEAQPLVLVEALAAGCAIVSSTAGEIPSTVEASGAILLSEINKTAVAKAISAFAVDPPRRLACARRGLQLFRAKHTPARHIEQWLQIVGGGIQGGRADRPLQGRKTPELDSAA